MFATRQSPPVSQTIPPDERGVTFRPIVSALLHFFLTRMANQILGTLPLRAPTPLASKDSRLSDEMRNDGERNPYLFLPGGKGTQRA